MRAAQAVMADLASSGLSAEQLALVMELSAAVATEARPAVDRAAENKRAYDREYRKAHPRKIRTNSYERNDSKGSHDRDILPSKEVLPQEDKSSSPQPWALPVGVSLQIWTDLKANRKRKRLPNTPTAWKKFQADLAETSAQTGIPPPKLIEMCTAKGWGAIYDPRDQRDERSSNPTGDALARVQAAIRGGSAFG